MLQGRSCEAQVMYTRGFRRYANFDTGRVQITHTLLKRLIEYLPDPGSQDTPRRAPEISTNRIRARIAELERAGLIEQMPKKSRFDPPLFRCIAASLGQVRLQEEPQRNHKEGSTKANGEAPPNTDEGTTKEPQEGNHNIPGSPGNTSPDGDASTAGPPQCPHQQIIAAWHEILPELPQVRVWNDQRKKHLQSRWREDKRHQSLEFWRGLFAYMRDSPFLMGQVEKRDGPPFRATLDWVVKPTNFAKVLERKYHDG